MIKKGINMSKALVGFDVGGTKIEIAVLSPQSEVLWRERLATPKGQYDETLNTIAQLLQDALAHLRMALPTRLGLGIPGCLDPQTQWVRGANSQVLNGRPLKADLQNLLHTQVVLENDANCLTLSESVDGAALGMPCVFGVILGTGCGGGLVLDQRIWSGANHIAGEFGHTPLPHFGLRENKVKPCWCGQSNCLERWVSGPAFREDHMESFQEDLDPETIVEAMRAGSAKARQSFELYVDRLARGLAQIVNTIDPSCIVLGGGMSNVGELYPALGAQIEQYAFKKRLQTRIVKAAHGDSSGVRGAAWLSRE